MIILLGGPFDGKSINLDIETRPELMIRLPLYERIDLHILEDIHVSSPPRETGPAFKTCSYKYMEFSVVGGSNHLVYGYEGLEK